MLLVFQISQDMKHREAQGKSRTILTAQHARMSCMHAVVRTCAHQIVTASLEIWHEGSPYIGMHGCKISMESDDGKQVYLATFTWVDPAPWQVITHLYHFCIFDVFFLRDQWKARPLFSIPASLRGRTNVVEGREEARKGDFG